MTKLEFSDHTTSTLPTGARRGTNSDLDGNGNVPSDDPLTWLSDILWPDGSARLMVEHRKSPDKATRRWWASPSADQPDLLIPADEQAAARRAVRRYHDGFDLRRWARSAAAEAVMARPDVANRLLAERVVTVEGDGDPMDRGVPGELTRLLDRNDLSFAITLARPKSNRKPVIQVLDSHGLVVGWAKVAADPWTAALIGNEAQWLAPPARPPLITPVVLHDTVLAGRPVVVTSSLTPGRRLRLRSHRPGRQPDPAVIAAIARLGTVRTGPIRSSRWWELVDALLDEADDTERWAIEQVAERVGGLDFSLGAWHGDFTPWNVMTIRDMAQVIDWEFAADEVPFGFDLCHFHTQVGLEMLGMSPAEALDYSARLSPPGLAALGVDPRNQIATWNLYRVELIRRTLALRRAGLATDEVKLGPAAVARTTSLNPDTGGER